jgi:eukaryotic-like serine/threonine-protein kinase
MNIPSMQWQDLEPDLDRLLAMDEKVREAALCTMAETDAQRATALRQWLVDISQSEGLLESRPVHPRKLLPDAPWRLLRQIGSGGMGEVWLAERADGAFERNVAIKFLRADRATLGERLMRERELLARLRHPGIAMLLDGGVSAAGEPYLVTEWIDGARLDEWVRNAQPNLRTRVDVLRRITEAVGYAHANLIVHRDLKPANVMIDRDGAPHLLDFGIARLLGEVDGFTWTQDRALTPAFASPEQLSGQPITTRSDVYALGGLLYWLICGRTPHDSEGLSLAELVKRVCEHDPPPPSALMEKGTMAGSADLDAIALKALTREPAARYPSADAMAQDLARWRQGEAVSARLPTRVERVRRFVRRNRLATALTGTTIFVLIGGIAGTSWQARQAALERDIALAESDRGEMVLDSFARLFREAQGEERLSASDWLDRAVKIQDEVKGNGLAARFRIFAALAAIEQDRGQAARAGALLERVLREGGDLLGADERAAARCRLGSANATLGKMEEARTQFDTGTALAEQLTGAQRFTLADCLRGRATMGLQSDRPGDSDIAAARRAVVEIDRLSPTRDLRWRRAGVLYTLASLLDITGRSAEAADAYEQVSRMDAELGQLETVDHSMVITAQAGALNVAGRVREADARYTEGIALVERVGGKTPNLATDLVNHAMVKNRLGDAAGAAVLAQRAVDLFSDLKGANPIGHANAFFELGKALTVLQKNAPARIALDEATTRMSAIAGAEKRVAPMHLWRARLALASGDVDGAQQQIDTVIAALRAAKSVGALAEALQISARVALARGNATQAEALAREAVGLFSQHNEARALAEATADLTLAEVLQAGAGAHDEVRDLARKAQQLLEPVLGNDHPQVRSARSLAGS